MEQGNVIRKWMERLGMTQQELAERLVETATEVRHWKGEGPQPGEEKNSQMESFLEMAEDTLQDALPKGEARWRLADQLFSEESMYARMRTFAQVEGLHQTYQALPYMRRMHAGQTRQPVLDSRQQVAYIVHPLIMACQAHAMGICDDTVLAVALLHDVCEDCHILPQDLPFSPEVREAVGLLTRSGEDQETYYRNIRGNRTAMLVKCLDRCQNLSTMAGSFSLARMAEYILETETYVLPILEELKEQYLDLSNAVFLLKYQMLSMLEAQKAMLVRLRKKDSPEKV